MHVREEPHPSSYFFRDSVAAHNNFACHVPSHNLQSFLSSGRRNYAYYFCTSLATACICSAPSELLQAALEDIVAFFDAGEMMDLWLTGPREDGGQSAMEYWHRFVSYWCIDRCNGSVIARTKIPNPPNQLKPESRSSLERASLHTYILSDTLYFTTQFVVFMVANPTLTRPDHFLVSSITGESIMVQWCIIYAPHDWCITVCAATAAKSCINSMTVDSMASNYRILILA